MATTDNQTKTPSVEELEGAREKAAEALFDTKPEDPSHRAKEVNFNSIEKELFVRGGGEAADFKYKYDVRHYFDFRSVPDPKDHSKIKQIASMAVREDGTLHTMRPKDEVINWRTTKVGARHDATNRESKGRYSLDDAGHLIALEFGTDPSKKENIADQNCLQNQAGGTWRRQETQLRKFVDSHTGCRVEVVVHYSKDQYGRRSLYWKMTALDENNVKLDDNVLHFNSKSHSADRAHVHEQARETRKTLAERNRLGLPPIALHLLK